MLPLFWATSTTSSISSLVFLYISSKLQNGAYIHQANGAILHPPKQAPSPDRPDHSRHRGDCPIWCTPPTPQQTSRSLHYYGPWHGKQFFGSRYISLIFLGCQISHHHFLRNTFRTCQPFPTLEKPQGLFYPQRYGSRLLGRCCFHDDSRKCQCLYCNKLCPWLGCVCTGRHSKV